MNASALHPPPEHAPPWIVQRLDFHLELAAGTGPALELQLLDTTPHRLSWMSLLARVFRIDVPVCQRLAWLEAVLSSRRTPMRKN